jgi:hypothetical protein
VLCLLCSYVSRLARNYIKVDPRGQLRRWLSFRPCLESSPCVGAASIRESPVDGCDGFARFAVRFLVVLRGLFAVRFCFCFSACSSSYRFSSLKSRSGRMIKRGGSPFALRALPCTPLQRFLKYFPFPPFRRIGNLAYAVSTAPIVRSPPPYHPNRLNFLLVPRPHSGVYLRCTSWRENPNPDSGMVPALVASGERL